MDSIQASLEAESRAKQEALRIKKKLESDINNLEIALDHANKANSEAHKSIKRYQGQLREVEQTFETESRQRQVTKKYMKFYKPCFLCLFFSKNNLSAVFFAIPELVTK